ncbi:MAG: 23S rRNA (uracil(1939)-C(5))-methyltransferase RlmD [Verrucomicrobia bacterium]|nr:23S rRNA (uracil(1939)-C(5))-methyltransferase RlmD [Verrucomicrobiota bacterium]
MPTKIVITDRFSSKGRGLSGNCEIAGALPGEEVLMEPCGRRKGFLRQVITPSQERVAPRCCHVPDCGGCALQHFDYQSQLKLKQQIVEREFGSSVKPIIGCTDPWRYRNKMEFSFSQNRSGEKFVGLMLAGSRGRVLNLIQCHLVSEWFSQVLEAVRSWWNGIVDLKAYRHSSDEGHLRNLTLREAKQGQGKMVMLTVSGNPDYALKRQWLDTFIETIKKVSSEPHLSIFLQVQQIGKGRPTQFFEMLLSGPDHITEKLKIDAFGLCHHLDFKISPTSFFQPNTAQAELLYSVGLEALEDLSGARVFDLYCGGATIGLSAAKYAKEVVGIELNHHSVFDAGWNQEVNQIQNFSIHRGDVGEVLERLRKEAGFELPDIVIVDPPRAGLDGRALGHLKDFAAKKILYISCNPKTQAENVKELTLSGYALKLIQPVDQFPHTIHIENICLLER